MSFNFCTLLHCLRDYSPTKLSIRSLNYIMTDFVCRWIIFVNWYCSQIPNMCQLSVTCLKVVSRVGSLHTRLVLVISGPATLANTCLLSVFDGMIFLNFFKGCLPVIMIVENIICENENILIHYSVTKWTFHSVWTDTFLGNLTFPSWRGTWNCMSRPIPV